MSILPYRNFISLQETQSGFERVSILVGSCQLLGEWAVEEGQSQSLVNSRPFPEPGDRKEDC